LQRDYTDRFHVFNGAILLRINDLLLLLACPLCDRVSKLHLHVGCAPQGVAFPRKAMHCEARA